MSWYLDHRPQTIGGLHLPSVRTRLQTMLSSGTVSHALLFAGTRGTGKTSTARILAKILNCEKNREAVQALVQKKKPFPLQEPCGTCSVCTTITNNSSYAVVEIDGATYRKIDDVRFLQDRAMLTPSDGLMTVFIIDEVHMLTTEAFNALLKLIEEPPAHVVFVLATTEQQKVPKTIQSRCEIVLFEKADISTISTVVSDVAKTHNLNLEDGVLEILAKAADGSFRDAIKMLEQVARGDHEVRLEEVVQQLHTPSTELLTTCVEALLQKNIPQIQKMFEELHTHGTDIALFQTSLLQVVYEQFQQTMRTQAHSMKYIQLMKMLDLPVDKLLPNPYLPFELACYEWCLEGGDTKQSTQPTENQTRAVIKETKQQEEVQKKPEIRQESPPKKSNKTISSDVLLSAWSDILAQVKKKSTSTEALLRSSEPDSVENGILTLTVFYPFHKEKLEDTKNSMMIEEVASSILETPVRLVCALGKKRQTKKQEETPKEDVQLQKSVEDAFM